MTLTEKAAKISALSQVKLVNMNLTGEEILLPDQSR